MAIRTRTSGILININVEPATAAYSGPGDAVPGAAAWWGMRAYTSSIAGSTATPLIQVIKSDGTTHDCYSLASGGLDLSDITTFFGGSSTQKICRFYDQTGNLNHVERFGGSSAPGAFQPDFVFSAMSSLPSAQFGVGGTGDNCWFRITGSSNISPTVNVPLTLSCVYQVLTINSAARILNLNSSLGTGAGPSYICDNGSSNKIAIASGGTVTDVTAAVNTWHGVNGVLTNDSSSVISVDGVETTVASSNGGNAVGIATVATTGNVGSGLFLGYFMEGGVWSGSQSRSALYTNQHTYYSVF